MAREDPRPRSVLQDEIELRWSFLEEEPEACVVVSSRMELVYMNSAARALVPREWFGKRCFEVFSPQGGECAWQCLTLRAVSESRGILYCEETTAGESGDLIHLGVALIPVPAGAADVAQALLLFRRKDGHLEPARFQEELLRDAEALRARLARHF